MNSVKRFIVSTALLIASSGAFAGIPVFDGANLAQQIQQVISWVQQYQQMATQLQQQVEQITTATQHLDSMTGVRGLGEIANTIGLGDMIPEDIQNTLQQIQQAKNLATQMGSITGNSLQSTMQRARQIQSLMRSINTTTDAKGVGEIQARITAETAAVQNEANRIQLMQMQAQSQAEQINNDIKQRNADNARSTNRVTYSFSVGQ